MVTVCPVVAVLVQLVPAGLPVQPVTLYGDLPPDHWTSVLPLLNLAEPNLRLAVVVFLTEAAADWSLYKTLSTTWTDSFADPPL